MAIKEATKTTTFSKGALAKVGEPTDDRVRALEKYRDPETKDEFRVSIETLWKRSQENFIQIGRYLIQAKEKLPRGEFDQMIASELPFNKTLAFMMRSVAQAIDAKKILADECPMDCTAAYQLVSLPPDKLDIARSLSLVKPTLRRNEIIKFRREYLLPPDTGRQRARLPKSEGARLQLKAKLESRIGELQAEMRNTMSLLREVCTSLNVSSNLADETIIDIDPVTVVE